jgi:hypothetical protein
VDVETAPGEGATFRVTLPLAPDDADLPPEPAELEEPDFGGGPLAVGPGRADEHLAVGSGGADEPLAEGDEPTEDPIPAAGDRAGSATAGLPADAGTSESADAASPSGGTGDADGNPGAGAAPDDRSSTVDDQAGTRPR